MSDAYEELAARAESAREASQRLRCEFRLLAAWGEVERRRLRRTLEEFERLASFEVPGRRAA